MSKVPPAVDSWIRKAENDLKNIRASLVRADPAWDKVCFHAQQAAEKYLKAATPAGVRTGGWKHWRG